LYGIAAKDEIEFSVRKYRELALQAIADVQGRGKVAIVCGGTNYYIESIIFQDQGSQT
jgi:tRNA dimethylallyltransferase